VRLGGVTLQHIANRPTFQQTHVPRESVA
jgi:hypothetical protein